MAEKRKPDTVLWIRHGQGKSKKVELFSAAQFSPLHRFLLPDGEPAVDPAPQHYRLRVDGTWFPAGRRYLYSYDQCLTLIEKEIFQ